LDDESQKQKISAWKALLEQTGTHPLQKSIHVDDLKKSPKKQSIKELDNKKDTALEMIDKDKNKDRMKMKEKETFQGEESGEETEDERELGELELDALYMKAQEKDSELSEMETPNGMTYTLRPYQKQALKWMVDKETLVATVDKNKILHPLWEEYAFQNTLGIFFFFFFFKNNFEKMKFI